jgi:hypothetical protein|tara:strand:- start:740 stop:1108 length:369 start_codon:yes stop_codon:yes gene_type:complete
MPLFYSNGTNTKKINYYNQSAALSAPPTRGKRVHPRRGNIDNNQYLDNNQVQYIDEDIQYTEGDVQYTSGNKFNYVNEKNIKSLMLDSNKRHEVVVRKLEKIENLMLLILLIMVFLALKSYS